MPAFPFSADGKWLAARRDSDTMVIVNVERNRAECVLESAAFPLGFMASDESLVALTGAYALETGNLLRSVSAGTPADAKTAGAIELWNWKSGTRRVVPLGHFPVATCTAAALTLDGTHLALETPLGTNGTPTVVVAETESGIIKASICVPDCDTSALAFSPNGRYLAIGMYSGTSLWEWSCSTNRVSLLDHQNGVLRAIFSRDGTVLATSDLYGQVRLWEVPSGKPLCSLTAFWAHVFHASFSPDGKALSTGGKLWHLPTHREAMSLDKSFATEDKLFTIEFSPDGRTLAPVVFPFWLFLTHLPVVDEIDEIEQYQPRSLAEALEKRLAARRSVFPGLNLLQRGDYAFGNERWQEAAEAFTSALEDPTFDWQTAATAHPCMPLRMGLVSVRASDAALHEKLCRSLAAAVNMSADPPQAARAWRAAEVCLLRPECSTPSLLQASNLLQLAESASTNEIETSRCSLYRGMLDYRSGRYAQAVESLATATRSTDVCCQATALVFRAMSAWQLGRDSEAKRFLQQAKGMVPETEDRAYHSSMSGADFRVFLLILDEAEKLCSKPAEQPASPSK